MMKYLDRSPAHLQQALREPMEETPSMLWGSIFHHVVLTPNVKPFWVVAPEGMKFNTKEGKAWKAEHEGARIISAEEWHHIEGAAKAVREHESAGLALAQGEAEVSVFSWYHYGGKVLRKGRIDFVNAGSGSPVLVDIKTGDDARPEAFSRKLAPESLGGNGYARQAAYYMAMWNDLHDGGMKTKDFVFIVVEKYPPYGIGVYHLMGDSIRRGNLDWQRLCALYMECQETNNWPCYDTKIQRIDMPPWALTPKQEGAWWIAHGM
jgi:hypothetical protein